MVRPQCDPERASLFANTAVFLAWAHLRTLRYVSHAVRYSEDWKAKSMVLDDSFRFFSDKWDKPYAKAVLRLIETRFNFNERRALTQVSVS